MMDMEINEMISDDSSEYVITDNNDETEPFEVPDYEQIEREEKRKELKIKFKHADDDTPTFFNRDDLSWLWEVSQWRALPNHVRLLFLELNDDFICNIKPYIFKVIDRRQAKIYYVKEYLNYEIDGSPS